MTAPKIPGNSRDPRSSEDRQVGTRAGAHAARQDTVPDPWRSADGFPSRVGPFGTGAAGPACPGGTMHAWAAPGSIDGERTVRDETVRLPPALSSTPHGHRYESTLVLGASDFGIAPRTPKTSGDTGHPATRDMTFRLGATASSADPTVNLYVHPGGASGTTPAQGVREPSPEGRLSEDARHQLRTLAVALAGFSTMALALIGVRVFFDLSR